MEFHTQTELGKQDESLFSLEGFSEKAIAYVN